MPNREKVSLIEDVFLRDSLHFEAKVALATGYNYLRGMLLLRDGEVVRPVKNEHDLATTHRYFMSVAQLDLTHATEPQVQPVVWQGRFSTPQLVLPNGVDLHSMVGKVWLVDVLRNQGLLAVERDYQYFVPTPIHRASSIIPDPEPEPDTPSKIILSSSNVKEVVAWQDTTVSFALNVALPSDWMIRYQSSASIELSKLTTSDRLNYSLKLFPLNGDDAAMWRVEVIDNQGEVVLEAQSSLTIIERQGTTKITFDPNNVTEVVLGEKEVIYFELDAVQLQGQTVSWTSEPAINVTKKSVSGAIKYGLYVLGLALQADVMIKVQILDKNNEEILSETSSISVVEKV